MSVARDKTIGPSYLTGLKHVPQIINIESLLRDKRLHAVSALINLKIPKREEMWPMKPYLTHLFDVRL